MPSVRRINVINLKTAYNNRAEKLFAIPYSSANMKQLAKAKALSPYLINRFFDGKGVHNILDSLRKADLRLPELYRNYDEKGNITELGQCVRKMLLKRHDLSETATIKEYFQAEFNKSVRSAEEILQKVKDNFDGSYGSK